MIKKNNDEFLSEAYWIEKLKHNLNKVAVQSKEKDYNVFNTNSLNSIIRSKKPKYSSVADAVKEMMERSGLTAYMQEQQNVKFSKKANHEIRLFKEFPQAELTLNNIIESMGGYSPIVAVISKLKSIHSNDIKDNSLFEDESLIKYVANKNMEEKAKNPQAQQNSLLGKIHHENDEEKEEKSILFDK